MEILFLLGRIIFGGYFIMSGMNHFMKNAMMTQYAASKGVPSAKIAVYFTGFLLILGGAGILLGAYTQLAVFLLAMFLIPISLKMHNFWAIKDPMAKMGDMVNFMKNMAMLGAALMTLAIPSPWAFSIF